MKKIELLKIVEDVQTKLRKGNSIVIPLHSEFRGVMGSSISENELHLEPTNNDMFVHVHNAVGNLSIEYDVYECVEIVYNRINWEEISDI